MKLCSADLQGPVLCKIVLRHPLEILASSFFSCFSVIWDRFWVSVGELQGWEKSLATFACSSFQKVCTKTHRSGGEKKPLCDVTKGPGVGSTPEIDSLMSPSKSVEGQNKAAAWTGSVNPVPMKAGCKQGAKNAGVLAGKAVQLESWGGKEGCEKGFNRGPLKQRECSECLNFLLTLNVS